MQIDLYREKFMSVPKKSHFNNGFQTRYFAEDPLYIVFSLFFEFDSPFLNPETNKGESAERFFKSMGDTARQAKVVEFRERLLHLVDQTPYLLKSIDGLSDLYDYTGAMIYNDREVKIETYETVDYRIAKLAELYTDIVWDFENQKRILPSNLEWINYHVISNDIRQLVTFIYEGNDLTMNNVTAYMDSFVLSFKHAKFSFAKSNVFLSSMNNEEPTVTNNSFRLLGGKFSKKKNRITLSNEEKSESITKISGNRPTEKDSTIEKISLKKLVSDMAVDYLRQEAAQLANKYVLEPLKNSLFQLMQENSFYGTSAPNLSAIISGEQSLNDLIPKIGSADAKIEDRILNKPRLESFVDGAVANVQPNTVDIQGMSKEELINLILNDVNKRLAYIP